MDDHSKGMELLRRMHGAHAGFRPGQWEAVQHLLNGKHILVVAPTGAGKSLVYQLGALLLAGNSRPAPVALVISPLIALMKDQVDSLEQRDIPATFINSAIPAYEQNNRLRKMSAGEYRIVYAAPERFRSIQFLEAVRSQRISLLAVDEAHCISEWGHDFRPDYLRIAGLRKKLGNPLTAALTATATPRVQADIIRLLGLPAPGSAEANKAGGTECIVTGFNRPNLMLQIRYTSRPKDKLRALREALAEIEQGAAIIYTGTRREAEEIAEFVREAVRQNAEHYHAGLDPQKRERIQDAFISGKLNVVAATNAFGMGIDRPDVRLVVHYNLPGSLEAYYQEAGRAGRDGLPAQAVLLYAPDDRSLQEWFIETAKTSPDDLCSLYNAIKTPPGGQAWLTHEELSRRSGMAEVKLKVALAELERAGAIEHLGDEGMRMLLKRGEWNTPAIVSAIQKGKQHLAHRKKQLDKMVWFAEANTCRRRILLEHFGDKGEPVAPVCCDNCLIRPASSNLIPEGMTTPGKQPDSSLDDMSPSQRTALIILDAVRRLKFPVGRQKLAQILKGSHAKDILNFGYNKTTYYARLEAFNQDGIEKMIDQLIDKGYFKVTGSKYPVLRLTPHGETAISEKAEIPLLLPRQLSAALVDKKCVVEAWKAKTTPTTKKEYAPEPEDFEDDIEAFLSRSHPRRLDGPWYCGWALGFHSGFSGANWKRSPVGELTYRLKYQGDRNAIPELLEQATALISAQPELAQVDAIVPTPASTPRAIDPVSAFAEALAGRLKLDVLYAVAKTRKTAPQKEFHTLAQKRANVAGAFCVQAPVQNLRVLLIDDLFDSGATLEEINRVLQRAGAARVCVLTLTRTIHSDA